MKILLCGPIAEPGKPAMGGFQSANLRLAQLLKRLSYNVELLSYPVPEGRFTVKALAYLRGFAGLARRIARVSSPDEVLHITPLIRHFLPFEVLIVKIARWRRRPVVVDVRAGDHIAQYDGRSPLYRALYRTLVRSADVVAYEGASYGPFLASLSPCAPRYLLPNFIPDALLYREGETRRNRPLSIVFVGRLCESKGVFRTANLFREVQRNVPDAQITFIGQGKSATREALIKELNNHSGAKFVGALAIHDIIPQLDSSHFFAFLSTFPGEGHSNALTEAMARGCVPLYTRHGFSADVAGSAGLALENGETEAALASRVLECWRSNAWEVMSRDAIGRVEKQFTETAVSAVIESIYCGLRREKSSTHRQPEFRPSSMQEGQLHVKREHAPNLH